MSHPFDPHAHWRDKALALLQAIAAHFSPPSTRLDELDDVLAVLAASPTLRADVARILDMRWSAGNAQFDEFLTAMEREQRYEGAIWREFLHLTTSGRRPSRDGIKAAARALVHALDR